MFEPQVQGGAIYIDSDEQSKKYLLKYKGKNNSVIVGILYLKCP